MTLQFYNYLKRLAEYELKSKMSNSLGLTLNEFKDRWNTKAESFPNLFKNIVEKNNNESDFQIKLDESIILMGNVINHNSEKIIKNITMIASGDGSFISGVNILTSIGTLIDCINPYEDVEFRKKLMDKLGVMDPEMDKGSTILVNEIKYTFKLSKQIGVWLSISRNTTDGEK